MTVNSDRLGGNLPLLKAEALSTQQKELYDRIIATWDAFGESAHFEVETEDGRLIGPFNPMLYSPAISSRLLELMDTEGNDTSLSSRVREVTILVGAVCGFDTGLAFTTRHGTPIEPRNFNRSFSRRIGKAAVPEITVHGARKTCGSMLATPEVHLQVAMQMLRHAARSSIWVLLCLVLRMRARVCDRMPDLIIQRRITPPASGQKRVLLNTMPEFAKEVACAYLGGN